MPVRIKPTLCREIPGGPHFQPEGGPLLKGESVDELVERLEEYRAANGQPEGNPVAEITQYYAKAYPWSVEQCAEAPSSPLSPRLFTRVAAWTNGLWALPPKKLLSVEDAEFRFNACLACPWRRKALPKGFPAGKETSRRLYLLRRAAEVPEGLGVCRYHGWDNSLACLLENPAAEGPPECWAGKNDPKKA